MADQDNNFEHTIITRLEDLTGPDDKYAYLVFLSGPMMGKMHHLSSGLVVVGRAADIEVPISDPSISRRHCQIEFSNGKTFIRDLGSTNGTFVNGARITEKELRDGDKVQLSTTTIFKYAYQDKAENVFHEEIYKMAVVDALTGAFNKRFFEDRIKEEFAYSLRSHIPLSLVMFDIDHFKKINDTYGHPAGDYVLAQIGAIARSMTRFEDTLARYGGEEFVILLKGSTLQGASLVSERIRKTVEEKAFEFEGQTIRITISIGIATLAERNFSDWEKMLKLADTLLYESKKNGRNRVTVC